VPRGGWPAGHATNIISRCGPPAGHLPAPAHRTTTRALILTNGTTKHIMQCHLYCNGNRRWLQLSGIGTTCFHHVVIKIRQSLPRPAARPTSTLLETGVVTDDCKCSRDLRLKVPSEARSLT
jgi:hypothetical protein